MSSTGAIFFATVSLWLSKREIEFIIVRRSLPPGDLGLPLLGHFIAFLTNPGNHSNYCLQNYGPVYSEKMLSSIGVIFTKEEDIRWVWNSERKGKTVGCWMPAVITLLGERSCVNVSGKRHRSLRRILEPAFAPEALRDYFQILDGVVQEALSGWSSSKDKPVFNSSLEFKMLSMKLVFSAAFGQIEEKIAIQLHDDFVIWFRGLISPTTWRIPGTTFAKAMDARSRILDNFEYLINKFKAEHTDGSESELKSLMERLCHGKDENGDPLSIEDLKDNMVMIVFAGHDTTFASLGSALHYLSVHPEIHDALEKEVKSFKDPLDFDELKNAPVLNAFLTEMWRMDPPAARAQRKVIDDVDFNGFHAKKGVVLKYCNHGALKNEETYPSPYEFNIQRFLPDNHPLLLDPKMRSNANKTPALYPVFGGGSRICVGNHFAKLNMRLFLTRLLQKYNLEVRNSVKVHAPICGWQNEFNLTPKQE